MATDVNAGITDPNKITMTQRAKTKCDVCGEYFVYEFPIGENYKCYQRIKCPECGEFFNAYTPFSSLEDRENDFGGIRFL